MSFFSDLGKVGLAVGTGGLSLLFDGKSGGGSKGTPNAYGIYSGDKRYASKTNAAIKRADWQRYKQDIRPIEDRLIGMYNNPTLRANAVQGARDSVAKAFGNSDQAYQQRMAGYGLQMSPAQQQSYSRQRDLAMGLADVNAANRANRQFDDRNRQIMAGSGQRYGLQGA